MSFDPGDARILKALQAEGRLTNQELAERVGMSASPCWRRVKRLEESGVIRGYQAVVDRRAVGLGVLAFV
ncbi:MAG TPA: Lrp/AsnC family transcriptional regulator, partial [Aliidongia sp.]|uniref:Lrp/AsnC family transcriptional regulator n=1 Tax=Aliidongia sp. TaxID=1914230 RepID=UPI002DDDBD13